MNQCTHIQHPAASSAAFTGRALGLILASLLSLSAQAVPFLQLDIEGGTYVGGNEESVVTTETEFTLFAHAERGKKLSDAALLTDSFYLAIAVTPNDGFDGTGQPDLGSFEMTYTNLAGNVITRTIDVTEDMVWGVPPIEPDGTADHDGGDLGSHGVYDTWFAEVEFKYSGDNTSGSYNVQDDAGNGSIAGNDMYYESFAFNLAGLEAPFNLAFDLYHVKVKNSQDYDVDYFAPFSKNAATDIDHTDTPVPAPGAALLLGLGLLIMGWSRRGKK